MFKCVIGCVFDDNVNIRVFVLMVNDRHIA